mgnify:CR=1 FL=1
MSVLYVCEGTETPNGDPGNCVGEGSLTGDWPDTWMSETGWRPCCFCSGVSGDVIHFTADQATFMGYKYWEAYQRAVEVARPVHAAKTGACGASTPEQVATVCHSVG